MAVDVSNLTRRIDNLFERLERGQNVTYSPPFTTPPQNRYRGTPDVFPTTADYVSGYRYPPNIMPARKKSPVTMDVPSPEVSGGNTLMGYCAVWFDHNGSEYIDTYQDWVSPGSWADTIRERTEEKRTMGRDWLLPHLWQHKAEDIIGKVVHLEEDKKGVFYETKLAMAVQRAREAYELAKQGLLRVSYGYDPIQFMPTRLNGKSVRVLKSIRAHELSSVTFPANELTTTYAKAGPYAEFDDMKREHQMLKARLAASNEAMRKSDEQLRRIKSLVDRSGAIIESLDNRYRYQTGYGAISPRYRQETHDAVARMDEIISDFGLMIR